MLTVMTCCMYLTSSFTSHEPLDQWCSSTTRLCQDVEALESTTPSNGLGGRASPSVARTRVIWDKYFGMSVLHACTYGKREIPMFLMRREHDPLRAPTLGFETDLMKVRQPRLPKSPWALRSLLLSSQLSPPLRTTVGIPPSLR